MDVNKPLWGYSTWKVIWVHLEQPEVVLTVFHFPALKVPTLWQSGSCYPPWLQALATDTLVDTAN